LNIVEELEIRSEYFDLARSLVEKLVAAGDLSAPKSIIAIGGESGSGKSTTAFCLENELKEKGINTITLHMDSYFKLPPRDNHEKRVQSLDNVGPKEVDLEKLNSHISAFKDAASFIEIPVVNYKDNNFSYNNTDVSEFQVMIVEGVYVFMLENIDAKISLIRTYKDTLASRMKRTRESYQPLVESILEIEHDIVSPAIATADYIIDKNYQIQ